MNDTFSLGSSIIANHQVDEPFNGTKQPIFIVGHPRSGTTLLRALLGAHPQIHMINEPDLFVNFRSAGFPIDHCFTADDRRVLMNHLRSIRSCDRYLESIDKNLINAFLNQDGETSFRETFEFLLPHPAEKRVWGTKTLQNGYFVRDILALYPHAIIIPIVRDPRAALLSTYRKRLANSVDRIPEFSREGIAFFSYEAMRWAATMDEIHHQISDVNVGSVYVVRYESIAAQPEIEMRALCNAIGIEYDSEMLNESRRQNDPVLQSDDAYAHQNLSRTLDASRAGRGDELPEWACYLLNFCAGDSIRRQGYRFKANPTLSQRLVMIAGLAIHHSKMKRRLSNELSRIKGNR